MLSHGRDFFIALGKQAAKTTDLQSDEDREKMLEDPLHGEPKGNDDFELTLPDDEEGQPLTDPVAMGAAAAQPTPVPQPSAPVASLVPDPSMATAAPQFPVATFAPNPSVANVAPVPLPPVPAPQPPAPQPPVPPQPGGGLNIAKQKILKRLLQNQRQPPQQPPNVNVNVQPPAPPTQPGITPAKLKILKRLLKTPESKEPPRNTLEGLDSSRYWDRRPSSEGELDKADLDTARAILQSMFRHKTQGKS